MVIQQYPVAADQKWYQTLNADTQSYSEALIIPGFVDDLVAQVIPGGNGTVFLEFTADRPQDIVDNPGSVSWIRWNVGSVSIPTAQTALGAVSAVRIFGGGAPAVARLTGNKRASYR